MHKPMLVILDEPTVGLDPHIRRQLWDIILKLKEEGVTVILTTHYLDEAEYLSSRVCILDKGIVRAIDKPENLKTSYAQKSLEDVFLNLMSEEKEVCMNSSVLKIFGWLVWRDLRVLKEDFLNNLIDAMVMPATFIIIGGYILPYLGMPADYGAFMIVSSLVMMCYSTTNWRDGIELVSDIQGDRSVSYELTLPIPSWLIFVKYSVAYALDAFFLNILTLPLGKLILGDRFSLAHLHIPKFILIYLLMNLFFGAFTVFLSELD